MATLLRSSKYIRCLNGFAQRIIIPHKNTNFVTKSLPLQVQCASSYLSKSYATVPALQRTEGSAREGDTFNKLDETARRFGRVFKDDVEATLSHVHNAGYVSNLDALLLIRCCGNFLADATLEERNILTQDIWRTFNALKIRLDVSHFNALLRVYLENNYEFSPIDFLTSMKDKNINPNRITYERLMLFYCKKGDIEGATKILEVMKEQGIPLSARVFDALIIGHSEANDMASAEQVIKVMNDAGIKPSASTYTGLLCAYAKRGDMESIRKVMNELETTDIYLQVDSFFEIVHSLAINGHEDQIDDILRMTLPAPNYNLEAIRTILKLLDTGHLNIALKILPTLKTRAGTDENLVHNARGIFLIKKLVHAKYPVEQIIETCKKLENDGTNVTAFAIATQCCLEKRDEERSIPLMKAWMENGGEIRAHYFWPLLVTKAREMNYQGILDILKHMVSFNVTPTFETIKEYVVPFAAGGWNEFIEALEEFNVPRSVSISAIACKMLSDQKIRNTMRFLLNYESTYHLEHFYVPLAEAVKHTHDTTTFVAILRLLQNSAPEKSQNIVDTAMRTLLKTILHSSERFNCTLVNQILEEMEEFQMTISPELGQEIRQYFQDNINPITDQRIEKLTSGDLMPLTVSELISRVTAKTKEYAIWNDNIVRRNVDTYTQSRRLIINAMTERRETDVDRLSQEMEAQGFTLSVALLAELVGFYCAIGDIHKAEKWVKRCEAHIQENVLDLQKCLAWAELLIKNNRFDDAIKFLSGSSKEVGWYSSKRSKVLLKSFLNAVSDTGNVEMVNEVFQVLIQNKYFEIDKYFVSPLINVHLVRNDIQGALDAFEIACKNYKCTPLKNKLLRKLIEMEDAKSLQRVTDLNSEIHGESNSLLDLVLSFIECGRFRQARKILETPELNFRGEKLFLAAERYINEGKMDIIEQFLEITKGLKNMVINRSKLYERILEVYCKKNHWQQGLALWTNIQDENIQPSPKFLSNLGHLLKRHGQRVPFEFEDMSTFTDDSRDVQIPSINVVMSAEMAEFYAVLDQGNVDMAKRLLQRSRDTRSQEFRYALGTLIQKMVITDKLDEATMFLEDIIMNHNPKITSVTYKTVWNALVKANKYERLISHGNVVDTDTKIKYRFHKYVIRAKINKIGFAAFLSEFEAKITDSRDSNYVLVNEGLHFTSMVEGLHNEPALVDKFRAIAERLASQQIYSPLNIIWSYYFEKNRPEADEIWNTNFANGSHVVVRRISVSALKNNDVALMERLYQKTGSDSYLFLDAKVVSMSSLIELYCKNGRVEEALKIANDASSHVVEEWMKKYPIYFKNFKTLVEQQGKHFIKKVDSTEILTS